ncbi:MAG: short-chain dehydrogenase [Candidatus Saccharibacteria bacterium]|nr:short-chain dehydrogenase [Candidatus Saccharibacteria bacterium]
MADEDSKVVVITGASSGIGRATAHRFAAAGYGVVVAARRKAELQIVAKECEEYGVRAIPVVVDTTDDAGMHKLGEKAVDAFGHFDVWVNDAGVYLAGKFEDTPLEDMRRVMDTNFFGYVHGSHTALTHFRSQGSGVLINISSVNASAPMPYVGVYSASKAAVRALDESLRMELRIDGLHNDIHVCTVMPSIVDTNIFQNAANYTGKEVQAPEPVYDAEYVARHIFALAEHPRREVVVGPAGKALMAENAHMPRLYERSITQYSRMSGLTDKPSPTSDGNLFSSIEENRGIDGGWREHRLRADHLNIGISVGLAVAAAGMAGAGYVLSKRKH